MGPASVASRLVLSDQQISNVESKTLFFGHQSVGADIIQGIRDLMAGDPRLKLRIVSSADPEQVSGPAFIEFPIGENGKPQSKNNAFAGILDKGMGSQGGIAMFKYCYVDVDSSTDIQQLFESYHAQINMLKAKYPRLKIVHITMPLTTVEPGTSAWIKTMLGRATLRDIDAKRNEFNALLRQTYAGTDPVFDLAAVESTHSDGSRAYFMRGGQRVYTLAPEFTTDGGHLNDAGRRAAAEQLLVLLAGL